MAEGARCSVEDCPILRNGICAIGHELVENCPNYQLGDAEPVQPADESSGDFEEETLQVAIANSDAMDAREGNGLGAAYPLIRVALVGDQRVGKTTLITSLFGAFASGEGGDLIFVESRTMVGFAKRRFLALLSSGQEHPATPRTSREADAELFHLAVSVDQREQHLLISDRSGEAYDDATSSTERLAEFWEFRGVDRIVFMLDGPRAIRLDTKSLYRRRFKQMMHALLDNMDIPQTVAIEVLVTKLDVIKADSDAEDQLASLGIFENEIVREMEGRGVTTASFRVAARPSALPAMQELGLVSTLKRWLQQPKFEELTPHMVDDDSRQIDRLVNKLVRR
jgi:hypothetical protein